MQPTGSAGAFSCPSSISVSLRCFGDGINGGGEHLHHMVFVSCGIVAPLRTRGSCEPVGRTAAVRSGIFCSRREVQW